MWVILISKKIPNAGRYAAHLHLNDRTNEKSTAHPATSLSGHLDPCGPALLFSQAGHFANAQ